MIKNKKENKERKLVEIAWKGINALDLGTILSMWCDGYIFQVNDGEISSLLMTDQSVC